MLTQLVFDLDDTLYPQGNGLWGAIGERINLYRKHPEIATELLARLEQYKASGRSAPVPSH